MKKALFSAVFISLFACLNGQGLVQETNLTNQVDANAPLLPAKKVEYSLSTGTSFGMGTYSSSSYFIAPQMNYQISPKFKLNTGVVFVQSNLMLPNTSTLNLGQQSQMFEQKTSETLVFANGDYQVNNKLTITGSVVKNFNSPASSKMQENGWRNSFQMMSMGFQYKITSNMSIGAEFKMVQSDNLYNPLHYNMYQYGSVMPGF
jgi:opacity protein-like surface antigen